jgi:HlyD family secretion protein
VKKIIVIVGVLLLLGVIGFASLKGSRREKGEKVYVEEVVRRDLSQIVKASGEIDPRVKVNLSAHVIGKIQKLYVEEGDLIRAGQPFLQLEQEAFLAQRDQWAAQLRSARTGVQQAEVSLADARHKLERARRLNQEGITSHEQLEAAELAETSAKLRVDEAREAVLQTQASLEKAQDDLSKTTIYSPLTGRVIALNAEEGEVVVSGTMNNAGSIIGTIADLSEILANVDVDETEIVDVRMGQEAILRVDALRDREYHGKVVEIGSSGFNRPQQPDVTFYEVKVLLTDSDEELRPGMSVRAEIKTAAHQQALVLPIQAVVERPPLKKDGEKAEEGEDDEVKVVFVLADGKARQRAVETGLSDETHVELLSGVKPGEKVVTGPYRTLRDLRDGAAVTISKTSEAADRRADRERERDENRDEGSDADDQKEQD